MPYFAIKNLQLSPLSNRRIMAAFNNCPSHLREALRMYTHVTWDVMRTDS